MNLWSGRVLSQLIWIGVLAGGIALRQPAHAAESWDAMQRGRHLTRLFFASTFDSLTGVWGPNMNRMMTPPRLADFRQKVEEQVGAPVALVDEAVTARDSHQVYTRIGKYEKATGEVEVTWVFDREGRVEGFSVQPARTPAPTRFMEYETKTTMRLPFDDEWYVFWGGRALRDNQHAASFDQRFAMDLLKRKDGVSHAGDGKTNDQYYCWGAKIVAPGAGTVLATTDGIDDNRPGKMNEDKPLGNHVIIDHGNQEYSFFCHLQRGSVAVTPGQAVKPGDPLGLCGNSGRSSEPHLHFHLQNKPEPLQGEGLPVQFVDYRVDGETVARGEPKRGQTIAPAPSATQKPAANGAKKRKAKGGGTSKAMGMGDAPRSGDAP